MGARIAAWIGACCLLLGLLGMHAIHQHGTPAAHAASETVAAPAASAAHSHGGPSDVALSAHAGTAPGGPHAPPGAATSSLHPAPGAESCVDCAQTHATTAAACLLALLAAALWLAPPRLLRRAPRSWRLLFPTPATPRPAPPRAPHLHELCILRT
ncbi:hypothetical protein BJH93_00925 [Kocuria polaris]|nr:hypothetical protein [Kocuria polaris]